ncbi:mevalonate kinase-like [Temnothorax nylanderi]|uniref:mevalonate kinase-like n=1 Tax=Temnothorax nylanderi TaxID=102681 RepID=UPI003A8BFF41
MYKFTISAPGRVFLSGDPTRYNELCIAASLDQRTTLKFASTQSSPQFSGYIEINFISIRLYTLIPLTVLRGLFAQGNLNSQLTEADLYELVRNFVNSSSLMDVFGNNYDRNNRAHQLSLQAFFLLLILISRDGKTIISTQSSFSVEISTELAIGEGLGSSASFATCLAACFYRWLFRREDVFDEIDLIDIFSYVYECERIIYNSPTGLIDSVISVYGSMVRFQNKMSTNRHLQFDDIGNIPGMKILLVSSNVSQKTISEQNEQMEGMRQSYPFIESVQRNIDNVVNEFKDTLEDTEKKIDQIGLTEEQKLDYLKDCCVQLATLIRMNQGLLCVLGMSHPNLDVICAIARQFSISFAGKLANNGGGGYAFILLSPDSPATHINCILNKLKSLNFSAQITNLNCNGVRNEPTL